MKLLFHFTRKDRTVPEKWGYVPSQWLETGVMSALLYHGYPFANFEVPQKSPIRRGDMLAEPSNDIPTFRLKVMPRGGQPLLILLEGEQHLVDHPDVATFPDARRIAALQQKKD